MANIRIKDLPSDSAPNQNDIIPIDLAGTRGATIKDVVESGRPTASKTEAELGVEPQKAMTPLTTKQAIDTQVGAAYVPKTVKVNAVDGLTGGGELSGDVTVGLTTTNIDRLNKVDGIEEGAQVNTVNSVNAKTGNVVLSAGDVGLGNVDNTSDASKPISTATQAALDDKANSSVTISAGSGLTGGGTLVANRTIALSSASIASLALADSAVQSVNGKSGASITLAKADVGLGNVDNTSDANKPISTATQTALNAKANSSVTVSAGAGLTGGGNLTANRSIALNAASIASLEKAETALQAPGGSTGQILAKSSNTDNDVGWVSSEAATAVSYGPQTLTEAQQEQARANIGAQQSDPSLDALAEIILTANKVLTTDGTGELTQSDITAAARVLLKLAGSAAANKLPYFNGADSAVLADFTVAARALLNLTGTAAANQLPYLTGASGAGLTPLTAFARTILGSPSGGNMFNLMGGEGSGAINGYFKLPNGLMVQWMRVGITGGNSYLTFPIAFPSACYACVATATGAEAPNTSSYSVMLDGLTRLGVNARGRSVHGTGGVATIEPGEVPASFIAVGV